MDKKRNSSDTGEVLRRDAEMIIPGETTVPSSDSELLPSPSAEGFGLTQQVRVKTKGVKLRVGAGPFASIVAWAGDGLAPAGFDMSSRRPGQGQCEKAEISQ